MNIVWSLVAALLWLVPLDRSSLIVPQSQQPSVSLPAELDRVLRDYERHWQNRNADSLATLFASDGFVLQMGQEPVRGRAAIAAAYRGAGGPLSLRALAFATADTVGYIIGAFAVQQAGPDVGKFILALKRERGGPWRIAADMDNPIGRR
jgi:ketosteroid isomerase-like protein